MLDVCFSDSVGGLLIEVRNLIKSDVLPLDLHFNYGILDGDIIEIQTKRNVDTLKYFYKTVTEKELQRVNAGINRLILLQNTVKIRYVNNKNLLDYLYMKFKVESASELDLLWQRYQEEVVERQKIAETEEEYSFYQKQLLHALFQYNLKDPNIWLHQAIAIVDNREMVEIRHELIERRQNIRKQMDYNTEVARNAQGEIRDIVDKYPQYTKEIANVISQYQKVFP